jgi:hypothetical protein
MKKYDQPTRDSKSILNTLFLKALEQFNRLRDPRYSRPVYYNSRYHAPHIRRTSVKDEEFKKWLDSHGYCETDSSGKQRTKKL